MSVGPLQKPFSSHSFVRTRQGGEICVRTVRIVLAIEWQAVGADGRFIAMAATIRMQADLPWRLCLEVNDPLRFYAVADDADGADGLPPASSSE